MSKNDFSETATIHIRLCPVGQFVPEHHTLPGHKSHLMAPDHLGGIEFDLQLVWSAQTFDSPYQLWRATSSYSRYQNTDPGISGHTGAPGFLKLMMYFLCAPGRTILGNTQSS